MRSVVKGLLKKYKSKIVIENVLEQVKLQCVSR